MDGTRDALIVATDDYRDAGLRRLRAPAHDAQSLARVLADPGIGNFSSIRTVLNQPSHLVGEAVMDFFAERALDDLLLVYGQPIFSPVATDGRVFYVAGHDCHVRAWAPDSSGAPPDHREVWAFRARKWFDASPTIHGNSLFIGGYDGRLHHLARDHGREKGYWYYQANGMIKGTAAVSQGTVVFGCYDSCVYGIDIHNGKERWPRYHAGDAIKAGVLVHGETVYAASRDGVLHLIDPITGQGVWQYHVGAPVEVMPIAAGRLVVVADSNGVVHAVDGKLRVGPATDAFPPA